MEGRHNNRNLRSEKELKKIKINDFQFVETDDDDTISKAEKENLEIIDMPENPSDYKPDNSDRPEIIREIQAKESQKAEQEKLDREVNRPNLLKELENMPYNYKTKTEYEAMSYLELVEYFGNVVQMPHVIKEAKDLGIVDAEKKIRKPLLDEIEEKKREQK